MQARATAVRIAVIAAVIAAVFLGPVDGNRCLRDFSVLGSTPDSVTVGWNYTCADRWENTGVFFLKKTTFNFYFFSRRHSVRFKIYYDHKGWNACAGGGRGDHTRGVGRGNSETE